MTEPKDPNNKVENNPNPKKEETKETKKTNNE
jgi:hypothetical protein